MRKAKRKKARFVVSDRGIDGCKSGGRRGVVLVLAKFTRKESEQRIFCLAFASVKQDTKVVKVLSDLPGGLKDDACHPEALSRFRVGGYIVNINGFLGTDLASLKGFPVDQRVRLACPEAVGVDPDGKETKKGEAGLRIRHVDGVGI
jgi:hypothetical protein